MPSTLQLEIKIQGRSVLYLIIGRQISGMMCTDIRTLQLGTLQLEPKFLGISVQFLVDVFTGTHKVHKLNWY